MTGPKRPYSYYTAVHQNPNVVVQSEFKSCWNKVVLHAKIWVFIQYCKVSCIAPWGYFLEGAIYETFSVCVQMFRNVVVSFAEGYSDVLDDKK